MYHLYAFLGYSCYGFGIQILMINLTPWMAFVLEIPKSKVLFTILLGYEISKVSYGYGVE